MKKQNILNLIKYHVENNDKAFKDEAYEIAKYFDQTKDYQLSEYIMSLISSVNVFSPQELYKTNNKFLKHLTIENNSLPLPDKIKNDVVGIINAIGHNVGINKFLFQGPPGTGKTETVKHIARILERELFVVNFDYIIDSKLGQTSKNIAYMFEEINNISNPQKVIILFDEIDTIALDRINSNDLREMGRATSSILKGLDTLNDNIVIIATTNLFKSFDKALIRRFNSIIDFSSYTKEDLIDIAEIILNDFLPKFKNFGKNIRLFRKIFECSEKIPYPGELKNLIKTALAFSSPDNEYDYMKRLFLSVNGNDKLNAKFLKEKEFTLREIEILTGISKSQLSREFQENKK